MLVVCVQADAMCALTTTQSSTSTVLTVLCWCHTSLHLIDRACVLSVESQWLTLDSFYTVWIESLDVDGLELAGPHMSGQTPTYTNTLSSFACVCV